MKCKAFDVEVELEMQAVTCPGVWLCPRGKVTLQIYMLGLCTQTSTLDPIFPLVYNEKFSFRKNFPNVQNLHDLDHKLDKEVVYMELIQWEDCENGNVLSTFKTNLIELLYPFPRRKGILAGVDVDLLMEATRKFPGILAPKIEISTKITIKEVLCSLKDNKKGEIIVVNPKLISNKCVPKRNFPLRQKKVCHTHRSHNRNRTTRSGGLGDGDFSLTQLISMRESPRKSCDHQTRREREKDQQHTKCHKNKSMTPHEDFVKEKISTLRNKPSCSDDMCNCITSRVRCSVCEKYKCVFPNNTCTCNDDRTEMNTNDTKQIFDEEEHEVKKEYVYEERESQSNINSQNRNVYLSKARMEQIQERLRKMYSPVTSPAHMSIFGDNLSDDECNTKFYKNLEDFYKQLYVKAHHKFKNEKDRQIMQKYIKSEI